MSAPGGHYQEGHVSDEKTNWFNVQVGLVCLAGFMGLLLILTVTMYMTEEPAIKLPVLVITGVMALFATLALVGVTFSVAGLADKTQALGLPEGSVRAAIAFSLVVIFSIVAIYFYSSAKDTAIVLSKVATDTANGTANATAAGAANVSAAVANANAAAATANDFAKTILAVVGTLMTAVTSFYFATRGALPTDAAASASKPTIVSVAPVQVATNTEPVDVQMTISGTDLRLAKAVKFQSAGTTVLATDVLSNDERVMCRMMIQPGLAPGEYDVIVTNSDDAAATLPKAFKVQASEG